MKVNVVGGDITQIPSDGLITAIKSGGMWYGGIDGAIMRIAGDHFHNQAATQMPLEDGQVIVAEGSGSNYAFQNVIFVVDDLHRRLREIIYLGLRAADQANLKTVTIPTIRLGVMLGVVEKTKEEAISEMVGGVRRFLSENPQSVEKIIFVVYNDPVIVNLLNRELQLVGIT